MVDGATSRSVTSGVTRPTRRWVTTSSSGDSRASWCRAVLRKLRPGPRWHPDRSARPYVDEHADAASQPRLKVVFALSDNPKKAVLGAGSPDLSPAARD